MPTQQFRIVDFSNGTRIGKIAISVDPFDLEVWKLIDGDQRIAYGAVHHKLGPSKPVSFITFVNAKSFLVARNAQTNPSYKKKGIASELFLFVNKVEGHKIISDVSLSPEGEALWKSLVKSNHFNTKIFYLPTYEYFDLSEIGKSKTQDGTIVASPETDNQNDNFYDENTNVDGQKFFYLLEAKNRFVVESDGLVCHYGVVPKNHEYNILYVPPRYFYGDHE